MRCEAMLMGQQCDREQGHLGLHHIEGQLPSDIGPLIDEAWGSLEEATEQARIERDRWRRAARSSRWAFWLCIVATVANVLAAAFRWLVG